MRSQKPQHKDHLSQNQKECPEGWYCPKIIDNRCKNWHSKNDRDNAKSFQDMLKRHPKEQVVFFMEKNPRQPGYRPLYLFDTLHPIEVINQKQVEEKSGLYHIGAFIRLLNKTVQIKFEKTLGPFDKYSSILTLLEDFCPR